MPQGLQVFDASGNLMVDVSNRLTRIMGIVSTGQVTDSITVPEFLTDGDPWFCIHNYQRDYEPPEVWVDGDTLNWSYALPDPLAAFRAPCDIIYGTY